MDVTPEAPAKKAPASKASVVGKAFFKTRLKKITHLYSVTIREEPGKAIKSPLRYSRLRIGSD